MDLEKGLNNFTCLPNTTIMKNITALIACCHLFIVSFSQPEEDAMKYAETIKQEELYDKLSILASDALEGRETGERGQKMAAAFISDHFKRLGLTPPVKQGSSYSYYQPVPLYSSVPGNIYFVVGGEKYDNFNKIAYYGTYHSEGEKEMEAVFVGKGSEQELNQVDVKGKAVIIRIDNPRGWRTPHKLAKEKGAMISLIVTHATDSEFNNYSEMLKDYLSNGRLSLEVPKRQNTDQGIFMIAPSVAAKIVSSKVEDLNKAADNGRLKKVKTGMLKYQIKQKKIEVSTENVLGYLEGSDLKDELLVLTAHYDHIGRRGDKINNGADDDGSGTSAIMEIAEAFVKAKEEGKGPRRSILFMAVSGEEKGLLGSAYYTDNPVFPLENTVVNLNIDMIGRIDREHKDNSNYIYLVGADRLSTELHEISEKVNETYTQFELDYTLNDENHPDRIYYRSDHWNFAKNNIPVIFYFNGVHEDYHRPTDTIDKIEFELLTKRTKLVYYTAWVLANRNDRLVVDKLQEQEIGNN